MKNDFVPREQVMDLKEFGFAESTLAHYNPNGVFLWKILCSDEGNDHTLSSKDFIQHKVERHIEAPYYFQAFRWIRENTRYRFYIFPCSQHEKYGFEITLPSSIVFTSEVKYQTYEEAEKDLLIKLIDIIKSI